MLHCAHITLARAMVCALACTWALLLTAPSNADAAAPQYVDSAVVDGGLTITKPGTAATGDLIVAVIGVQCLSGVPSIATPAGWTLIRSWTHPHLTTMRAATYYRRMDGTEGASFAWTASGCSMGIFYGTTVALTIYRGADAASPIDAEDVANFGTAPGVSAPTVTTSVPDTRLMMVAHVANNGGFTLPVSGYATRQDVKVTSNKSSMLIADRIQAAAGPTGSTYVDFAGADAQGTAMHLAIRPPTPTITGFARQPDGAGGYMAWSSCNLSVNNIGIVVAGGLATSVPCDPATGAYEASPTWAAGQIVTVYQAGVGAATVRVPSASSTTPITMDINNGRIRLEPGATITNTLLRANTADVNPNIPIMKGAGSSVQFGAPVDVRAGAVYTPGADVEASKIRIGAGAQWNAGSSQLTLTGTGTGSCTASASRPFCRDATGTFASGTGTIRYTGTGPTTISGGSFNDVVLAPVSGSPTYELGASDEPLVSATGTVDIGNGVNPVTVSTSATNGSLDVAGLLRIMGSATLTGSGTGSITAQLNVAVLGDVTLTDGTFALRGSGNGSMTIYGGSTPVSFGTFEASSPAGASMRQIIASGGGRAITVYGDLRIGRSGETGTQFTVAAYPQPITVHGSFEITDGDTFAHGTGAGSVMQFAGAGTSTITRAAGATGDLYKLIIATPGKTIQFASAFSITGELAVSGTACTAPVVLRSSAPGLQRALGNPAATTIAGAVVQDLSFASTVTATSSVDAGGNANINFAGGGAGACGSAADGVLVDGQDASAGAARYVDGASTFSISSISHLGFTAVRQRTRVLSTPVDATVSGLWHFDEPAVGSGSAQVASDASSGALTLEAPDAAGARNPAVESGSGPSSSFDRSLRLTGTSAMRSAGAADALGTPSFTVEMWVRASAADLAASGATPVLVERGDAAGGRQFSLRIDRAGGRLVAATSAGGIPVEAATSVALVDDDAWHHVAMSVEADAALPGPGELRLFVDGVEQAVTTFVGATPASVASAPELRVGEGATGAVTHYAGRLDELRISSVARRSEELRGYRATHQPHGRIVWQSADPAGDLLSPACASETRCAAATYTGAPLRDGGRWYVQQQHVNGVGSSAPWSAPV